MWNNAIPGEELNMETSLFDLGVAPNGTVQFEILAAKEEVSIKSVASFNKDSGSSDFITVRVQKGDSKPIFISKPLQKSVY